MSTDAKFTLVCSCGWTHVTSTRKSATAWKSWHRRQHTEHGQRASDSGHVVKVEYTASNAGTEFWK